jgi:hypothetical protein
MKRKTLLVLAVSTALAASPALAETHGNAAVVSVTNQLEGLATKTSKLARPSWAESRSRLAAETSPASW